MHKLIVSQNRWACIIELSLVINLEAAVDVQKFFTFSKIDSQRLMHLSKHWKSNQAYTALNYIAKKSVLFSAIAGGFLQRGSWRAMDPFEQTRSVRSRLLLKTSNTVPCDPR